MSKSTPEQLRFPPVAGLTVRGDFDGGALSSDFGPMILLKRLYPGFCSGMLYFPIARPMA
jgi:hypothetical protein